MGVSGYMELGAGYPVSDSQLLPQSPVLCAQNMSCPPFLNFSYPSHKQHHECACPHPYLPRNRTACLEGEVP